MNRQLYDMSHDSASESEDDSGSRSACFRAVQQEALTGSTKSYSGLAT